MEKPPLRFLKTTNTCYQGFNVIAKNHFYYVVCFKRSMIPIELLQFWTNF
jgi:hypothetical protein